MSPRQDSVSASAENSSAVLLTSPGNLELRTIEFEPPGSGQVSVRMAAAGVCHTDLHIQNSADGWGRPFPLLLGHEGAGVVEKVGPEVDQLKPGDHVAIACRVPCSKCALCLRGDTRRCSSSAAAAATIRVAGTSERVTPALGIGLFAERVVVDAQAAVFMPNSFPLDQASIMGCALMTGVGAVVNTADVFPGASVAVIGCGGIGLSAVQGARLAGAGRIFAIDLTEAKVRSALKLGATDAIDGSVADAVSRIRDLTQGRGVDFAFEAVGSPLTVQEAYSMIAVGGVVTIIGVPPADSYLSLPLGGPDGVFSRSASIRVSHGGDSLPQHDLNSMRSLAEQGRLNIKDLITHRVSLAELPRAFEFMEAGEAIRTIVDFELDNGE